MTPRRNRPAKKCATKYCRSVVSSGHKHCHKCRAKQWDQKTRIRKQWRDLKASARKRKIKFDLPFEYFYMHVKNTPYADGKKTHCIDRIWNDQGYVRGNIAVVPCEWNEYWSDKAQPHEKIRHIVDDFPLSPLESLAETDPDNVPF